MYHAYVTILHKGGSHTCGVYLYVKVWLYMPTTRWIFSLPSQIMEIDIEGSLKGTLSLPREGEPPP